MRVRSTAKKYKKTKKTSSQQSHAFETPQSSTHAPQMEAQIIYFYYRVHSSPLDKGWNYAVLPMITGEYQNFEQNAYHIMNGNFNEVLIEFLKFLGHLCAEDGAMKGWKPYHIHGPVSTGVFEDLQAMVIIVREQAPCMLLSSHPEANATSSALQIFD